MAAKKRYLIRYVSIALVFCMVCVVYMSRLFSVQFGGRPTGPDNGETTTKVKVSAVRGEIFDRNGVALVSNRYSYDLTLSYGALSTVSAERANNIYLTLLDALDACGVKNAHTESWFPLSGTYPDYAFSDASQNPDSPIHYRLQRVLKNKGMKETATLKEILKEYTGSYNLLAKDERGNRIYSDYQVDRLIRLHYDMDAMQFNESNDYVFASGTDATFMTYVREMSLTGVNFTVTAARVYNYPGYASHILGSVGPIYAEEWDYYNEQGYQMNAIVGKSGCESAFEEYLHGTDGEWLVTLDADGNVIRTEVLKEPVTGNDVYLTIDINLQIAAEDALRENVEYVREHDSAAVPGFESDAGAAVAMDPNTFEILAIASYPSFDLNTFNKSYNDLLADPARPLTNRALREIYAPGSTFKLGIAAAGLNENEITASTLLPCSGVYTRFDDYRPKCSTWPHGSSSITVAKAIAVSCNCFFYELGYRLGIGRIDNYMARMGFGRSTGIELGEAIGTLAGESGSYQGVWTPGNTVATAIGQSETKATPLQLCAYISTLANGGTRYSAHLLDRVCSYGSGEILYSDEDLLSSPLDHSGFSPGVLSTVLSGMRQMVTESNTVQRFLTQSKVRSAVGGKTGTAQFDRYITDSETGERLKFTITNALFVGVAPYNAPEITVAVVIEKASSGTYASLTAARIIAAWEASRSAE